MPTALATVGVSKPSKAWATLEAGNGIGLEGRKNFPKVVPAPAVPEVTPVNPTLEGVVAHKETPTETALTKEAQTGPFNSGAAAKIATDIAEGGTGILQVA